MKKVIIISGPTATGKTGLAIRLAKSFSREAFLEIVNFDSLLFYRELNIGTAKPSSSERQNIVHHLVDIASVADQFNASHFVELARKKIKELHQQNIVPILVGGSAFYLRALLKGMYHGESLSEELTLERDQLYQNFGIKPFRDFLNEHDLVSFQNLHENDHYRIIRAWEYFKSTGKKISDQKAAADEFGPYNFSDIVEDWDLLHLYLDIPKEDHWTYIQERTSQMEQQGLKSEVESLLARGYSGEEKALRSIGYKEMIQYLNGHFDSIEDCLERISISTRQLAKAQRTFFNKIAPKRTFDVRQDWSKIEETVAAFLTGESLSEC